MTNIAREIIELLSSRHYHELAAYDPPFDPMEVLGVTGRELNYSSVLAWLLRDPVNKQFRQIFLSRIDANLRVGLESKEDEPVVVEREYGDEEAGRIDVFANFHERKLVVAIEVKVWANEGQDQISRYQAFLSRRFADSSRVIVFLSPHGISPSTALESTGVPVVPMSWRDIADVIGECRGQGDENDFRVQFRRHICRSVLMTNEDERRIVIDLLRQGDNATTIRKIIDNLPNIGETEYIDRWRTIVSDVTSIPKDALQVQKYPKHRNDTRELWAKVPRWSEAGLPFTMMLYKYGNGAVRVLLHRDEQPRVSGALGEFSKSSEGVVGDYPPVARWSTWHSVLKSHGNQEEPVETLIDGEVFEERFWVQAEEKLKEQLDPLRFPINQWLERDR